MKELKVLVVDDEIEFAKTMAERMALRSIHAEVATEGKEALDLIKEKDFDVVVLDLVLQQSRGLEVLKEIKSVRPELAVILLSGRGSDYDVQEGKRIGAFDYLIKPVQIEDLIEKMKQAIRRR